ncbi:stress protein [Flammeovirga pectinis]|uniref:Stress protein n=1 Tax=Flammeovirga pectinis TaxID=2494373 RepID=A0A3S9P6G4_9BACT|nr:Dabb family protein [Flammeovirga pectinis]AZQ63800.1 stress protein [Flammeovirga pectinis]
MIRNFYLLLTTLLLASSISWAQTERLPQLYRTDFKDITANNTVTVTSYKKQGIQYVYAGGFGNIDVYTISKEGKLTAVSNHELYKQKGPARGMVADNIGGTDFLFVANKHGNAIETFKILENGALTRVSITEDTPQTHLGTAITLEVVHMKKSTYLFVGGLEETPGLSCFRILGNGTLTHVQSIKDTNKIYTDGIIGMFTHRINGKTFLYTSGFQDNGVSSFKIAENGHFKNINNISDNDTDRYLTGAYPVNGVQLGSNYYVIVGHRHHKYYKRGGFIKKTDFVYHGDAVSVFKVDKNGALVPHSTLKDNKNTLLQGQTRIEIIEVKNKEAIIAIGTRDDASIQLCKLTEDGQLQPLNYLETGFSIYYGLNALTINNQHFLVAGSNRFDLKKVVAYKVAPENKEREGKVLRHIVNLKFKESSSQKEIDEALAVFENLKNKIPSIAKMEWGLNDSTEGHSKGFHYCFTLTFNASDGREIYLFHKDHLALIPKIAPLLDDILVMDYWTTE